MPYFSVHLLVIVCDNICTLWSGTLLGEKSNVTCFQQKCNEEQSEEGCSRDLMFQERKIKKVNGSRTRKRRSVLRKTKLNENTKTCETDLLQDQEWNPSIYSITLSVSRPCPACSRRSITLKLVPQISPNGLLARGTVLPAADAKQVARADKKQKRSFDSWVLLEAMAKPRPICLSNRAGRARNRTAEGVR